MASRILDIRRFGQQVWLDDLSRQLILSGKLKQLIDTDGISGITSNPTIFYKAISDNQYYQDELNKLKQTNLSLEERYEALVIPDIKMACDLMLPIYNSSNYENGYVSFELPPELAHDLNASIMKAKQLWQTINRPNLMIKIPGTESGILALESLISEGININITLLFSIKQVEQTWDAYIRGLEKHLLQKKPLNKIKAVASFFLSRIDATIDSQLPQDLQGKTAITLAKTAYTLYQTIFAGTKFSHLKNAGAKPQDLLWASTGTKNPNYSDVMYVEELIATNTINTIPNSTLDAFRNHGIARNSLEENIENAANNLDKINRYIDLEQLGVKLQLEGLKIFATSFQHLMGLMK